MTNAEALAHLGASCGSPALVDPKTGRRVIACENCDALLWFDASEGCVVSALCDACEADASEAQPDESMDGDHDSTMTSIGWGTDEDYGYYGDGE